MLNTEHPAPNEHTWNGDPSTLGQSLDAVSRVLRRVSLPVYAVASDSGPAVTNHGVACFSGSAGGIIGTHPLLGYAPALRPETLGDPEFKAFYGIRYPYIAGAMANGITSVDMVEAVGRAGMLGFFGAAGLPLSAVASAIDALETRLGDLPYGFNLIHSPHEPDLEAGIVDLYLKRGVRCVSASAFLRMTLPLVAYRIRGVYRDNDGNVVCPNKIIGKVSRVEVAEKFLSPPPAKMIAKLRADGRISEDEAALAAQIPMADNLTAEADSGGHTDNRPALTLLPTMMALRDRVTEQYRYPRRPKVGLGGGIAAPESAAAALSMGAAFILTGTVNQACVESGTCDEVRQMLAEAGQADVIMAPAADMFELGVKVQVLKRGTMFPVRATKLYEVYQRYGRWEDVPHDQQAALERDVFRRAFDEEWRLTREFFLHRDPKQVERAEKDPRHLMALVFRSYLGQSSKWSVNGVSDRKIDYQIWCGPAIGAFNEWTRDTFLEQPQHRKTVTVARNMLFGACVQLRASWLRQQGVPLDPTSAGFKPVPDEEIDTLLQT